MAYIEYYSFIENRADKKWNELYEALDTKTLKENKRSFNETKKEINTKRTELAITIGEKCLELGYEPLYVHWNGTVKTIDRRGETKNWSSVRIIEHVYKSRSYLYPSDTASSEVTPKTPRRTLTDLVPQDFAEFHRLTYELNATPLKYVGFFSDTENSMHEYDLAEIDLFFGGVRNTPFSEQRIFRTFDVVKDCLLSCAKVLDFEVDRQLVPTNEGLLKMHSSISHETLDLITPELVKAFTKRGDGAFDYEYTKGVLFTFLRELRPVAADIKENPEAMTINYSTKADYMYSYNPKDKRALLKERAKKIRSSIRKARRNID